MKTKLETVHFGYCVSLWIAFGIGVLLTAIDRFGISNEHQGMFFKIVHPYNSIVLLFSLLAILVELVLGGAAIRASISYQHSKHRIAFAVVLPILTGVFWLLYVSLFVMWTGGV